MTTTSIQLCWTRTSLSTRCFRQCRNIPTLEPLTGLRPERASMAEALTTATKLLVVREIQEDESGATLCFQQGAHVLRKHLIRNGMPDELQHRRMGVMLEMRFPIVPQARFKLGIHPDDVCCLQVFAEVDPRLGLPAVLIAEAWV